ncbi:hypothetical protein [Neobacillus sp. D3-1R]|uniref:hypothetical protein n=1 Tax=Neobacillus sp. D3-1R TaxID=3445778 RepID=UPI003F9F60AB
MGFRSSRFIQFVKDLGEIASDAKNIVKEGRQEFTEIMTDGFKEMVIKNNNDYKTSFEKKDQAHAIMQGAKSRLNAKFEEVDTYARETEAIITKFYDYKLKITNDAIHSAKITMDNFKQNDWQRKIILEATFLQTPINGLSVSKNITKIGLLNLVDDLFVQSRRVQAANEYLEDAKDFKTQVDLEIARLDSLKARMTYIRNVVKDEQRVLDLVNRELEKVTNLLNGLISRDTLSEDDAKTANQFFLITEMLYQFVNEKFVSKDLEVAAKYLQDLAKLERLILNSNDSQSHGSVSPAKYEKQSPVLFKDIPNQASVLETDIGTVDVLNLNLVHTVKEYEDKSTFIRKWFTDIRVLDDERLVAIYGIDLILLDIVKNRKFIIGQIKTNNGPYVLESSEPLDLYKNILAYYNNSNYQFHLYDLANNRNIISFRTKSDAPNLIRLTEEYIYSIHYLQNTYGKFSVSIIIYDYKGNVISNVLNDPIYVKLRNKYNRLLSLEETFSVGRITTSEAGDLLAGIRKMGSNSFRTNSMLKDNEVVISTKDRNTQRIALTRTAECIQIIGKNLFVATRESLFIYDAQTLRLLKNIRLPQNDYVSNILVKNHRLYVVQGDQIHIYE